LLKNTCHYKEQSTTKNSAIADKPRDTFRVSQGHQTWYHSICWVWFPISVL